MQARRNVNFKRSRPMASMNQIRSVDQEIYSIKLKKVGLSLYDHKRYILENSNSWVARIREKHLKHE